MSFNEKQINEIRDAFTNAASTMTRFDAEFTELNASFNASRDKIRRAYESFEEMATRVGNGNDTNIDPDELEYALSQLKRQAELMSDVAYGVSDGLATAKSNADELSEFASKIESDASEL